MKNKYYISWEEVLKRLTPIDSSANIVYGVPSGGMIAAGFLERARTTHKIECANVILDDIIDSGKTREHYASKYPNKRFFCLVNKESEELENQWVVFPWEKDHPNGETSVEDNIIRQLQYLGENCERPGLIETPKRVVKSWDELFSGYHKNPEECFKVFEAEKYDEIVLLKNIEMYSMCEHHMLPFYGKAHIAYIADGNVIGISKLARLLDVYARRLQIQERICQQITSDLDTYLNPLGSACIIEAQHMCMTMRGVGKQNSIMTTSSLTGRFRNEPAVRSELMSLIKS